MIDIQKLADDKGVARSYIDANNVLQHIDGEYRKNALEILGYPVNDQKALEKVLTEQKRATFKNMVDPVIVINDQDFKQFYFRIEESASEDENATVTVVVKLEDGRKIENTVLLSEVEIAQYETFEGVTYDTRRYKLISHFPYGYHELSVSVNSKNVNKKSAVMSLIVTPYKMYLPEEIASGKRVWGVSSQLYSVRSHSNWGIGDFSDLKQLLLGVKKCGGEFVGLNPMHAGYPYDPNSVSPYSPSSRNYINIVYISVNDVPELLNCPQAQELIHSEQFQQKLRVLREKEYVDYRGVLECKLEALRCIFDNVKVDDKRSNRGLKFLDFVEQGGEDLQNFATYDALMKHFHDEGKFVNSWEQFPSEYHDIHSPFVKAWAKEHEADVKFFCYLQFLASEQLTSAYKAAKEAGMLIGTYRDLAVGVAKQSCDVWGDVAKVFRTNGSIGCPPDPLGPLGQNWGLAPMSPEALKQNAYKPLIRMYKSNMKSCGAMRIDHAAGLYRLWLTRVGDPASKGAYVHYDLHDLLSILSLESHRNKCLLICEDLGTIPVELTKALRAYGALSYKTFFDGVAEDGGFIAPKDYIAEAMSALTTHDMPTLVGWWNYYDLSLGQQLGIYKPEEAQALQNARAVAKQRILDSMHGLGSIADTYPRNVADAKMDDVLSTAMQVHLCSGSCYLFSSQVEDWIGVDKPVNIPGTLDEYPNWRRKLTKDLEDIFEDKKVLAMTKAMTEARNS